MADTSDSVLWNLAEDGVVTISFHRPTRKNAWTMELEERYFENIMRASADPDVRAIVITGAPEGGAFCPGLDLEALSDVSSGQTGLHRERWPHTILTIVPKPVVAAINGACAGIGLIQALFADVRFASAGSKLTTAFARRGLPAENALAWVLPRLVGHGVAADLLLSARVFTAEEAAAMGMIKEVTALEDLMPTALAYAADLAANCSPGAMAQIKGQLYGGLDTTLEEARQEALRLLYTERLDGDFSEGVASFVDRRAPKFSSLGFDLSGSVIRDS